MIIKSITKQTDDFLQSLLRGNRQICSAISRDYLSKNPSIIDLYEDVFKEALYEVGRLWETNKINVASEHLATAITEGILNELYAKLELQENKNKKVVLTCVENEYHQVGIKMVADVFEMNGWNSYFIGTGIPTSQLKQFIRQENPNVLAISLSIYFNYQNLLRMIYVLKNEFPELTIIAGGQGFEHFNEESAKKIDGVNHISDLHALDKYLKTD